MPLPLAGARTGPQAFYCGLRLLAIDGSNIEVPGEAATVNAFGYPGSRPGVAGYPQAQCAVLVECATHAIIAANMGVYRDAEWTVCHPLLASLNHTMLCLADRGFFMGTSTGVVPEPPGRSCCGAARQTGNCRCIGCSLRARF